MNRHRYFTILHLIVVKTYLKDSPYLISHFLPESTFHVGVFEHDILVLFLFYPGTVVLSLPGEPVLHLCGMTRNFGTASSSCIALSGVRAGTGEFPREPSWSTHPGTWIKRVP